MRRADRLLQIIELLRGRRMPVTAAAMAETLEVSVRTVYRDIADLMATGVPITGETGIGYVMGPGYHIPPVMFDEEELEALALGASMVAAWTDPQLGEAARRLRAKISAVLPASLTERLDRTALMAAPDMARPPWSVDMAVIREAIRDHRRLNLTYADESGTETQRTIRPVGLVFFGYVWLVAAWCELREDFRNFRLDRMVHATMLDGTFPVEHGKQLSDFLYRVQRGGG